MRVKHTEPAVGKLLNARGKMLSNSPSFFFWYYPADGSKKRPFLLMPQNCERIAKYVRFESKSNPKSNPNSNPHSIASSSSSSSSSSTDHGSSRPCHETDSGNCNTSGGGGGGRGIGADESLQGCLELTPIDTKDESLGLDLRQPCQDLNCAVMLLSGAPNADVKPLPDDFTFIPTWVGDKLWPGNRPPHFRIWRGCKDDRPADSDDEYDEESSSNDGDGDSNPENRDGEFGSSDDEFFLDLNILLLDIRGVWRTDEPDPGRRAGTTNESLRSQSFREFNFTQACGEDIAHLYDSGYFGGSFASDGTPITYVDVERTNKQTNGA